MSKANSNSKPTKADTGDLRKALENADMSVFDKYMKWLVNVPKDKIDKGARVAPPKSER